MDPNELLNAEPKTRREAAELHGRVHAAAKSLFEKGDDMTEEDTALFDQLQTKGDAVKALIEKFPDRDAMKARLDAHESFIRTPVHPARSQGGANANSGRMRVEGVEEAGFTEIDRLGRVLVENGPAILGAKAWDGMQDPTYTKAFFNEYLRRGERMSAAAYKALEAGLDDQGGYFAPPQMLQRIVGRQPAPTRWAGMVDQVTTTADSVVMSKVNYVGSGSDDPDGYIFPTGFRSSWGTEVSNADGASVDDTKLFGTIRIPVYTNLITGRISTQMAEDAGIDIQGWVEAKFNQTIDLLYEQMAINGTGVNMPLGLVYAAKNGLPAGDAIKVITSSTAGALKADDIITVSEDVPEQYDEDCRYLFSKTETNKAIRLLKDGQQRPIFTVGYGDSGYAGAGANRRMLNNYETVWSQFMPSIATGNIPIIFGDPKGYTRVTRLGFSIQVLKEIEALKQRIVLMGRLRFGGAPVEPFRFRALKIQ